MWYNTFRLHFREKGGKMLNSFAECLKGLTDVPLAVIALILGIILRCNTAVRRGWSDLLFLIALSALLGIAVHTFAIPRPYLSILWLVLYPALFELVRLFSQLIMECVSGDRMKEKCLVRMIELVLCTVAVVLNFMANEADIFVFALFCFMLLFRMLACILRCKGAPGRVTVLLILLTVSLLLLALKYVIPNSVPMSHIICTVSLFIIYCMGKDEAKITLGSQ